MTQLHKRFSDEQVAFLLHSYSLGLLSRQEAQDSLLMGKTRFFELWKLYQTHPDSFSIAYQSRPSRRISLHFHSRGLDHPTHHLAIANDYTGSEPWPGCPWDIN